MKLSPPTVCVLALLACLARPVGIPAAEGPPSEDVEAMVGRALDFLKRSEDERLGAKCLAAMCFLKTGAPLTHPVVQQGIRACREAAYNPFPIEDVYSNGLAVILLCQVDPKTYQEEINRYIASLYARQKPHGGWGYEGRSTGDTSQTQYAVLGLWTAHRVGIRLQGDSILNGLNWLMRTQDPSGGWGYQGRDSEGPQRIAQDEVGHSMCAAGFGSTLMCAHMLGFTQTADEQAVDDLDLPPAVTRVVENTTAPPIDAAGKVDEQRLEETIRLARRWMDQNYTIEILRYNLYYMYALERYKSFDELVTGQPEESPKWYRDGVELLKQLETPDGGWSHGCGPYPDTAFGILFLVRSTQKTLRAGIGDGLLVGGRGLPSNVAQVTVHRGQLFTKETARSVDDLVRILEDPNHPQYEELLRDPRGLRPFEIGQVTDADVPRLVRLIHGGDPVARLVSVQALAVRDSLDDVPTLIFALTDPDRRVVLAARDALRQISRRTDGFGLTDGFTEGQRFDAIEAWKAWYLALRPDAVWE
jgi:hypothetical protein